MIIRSKRNGESINLYEIKKKIVLLLLIIGVGVINAQIPKNSIFIIVDKVKDSINLNEPPLVPLKFEIGNENKNWLLIFEHLKDCSWRSPNYSYILPKAMIEYMAHEGNVISLEDFKKKVLPLTDLELRRFLRATRYPYEYLEKNNYKTGFRYNIFLIFRSEMKNSTVKCYELGYTTVPIYSH